jgi:hypothetical protein
MHRRPEPAVRDELITRAGGFLKKNAGEVAEAADAGRALHRFVRIGLQPRYQTFEIGRRNIRPGHQYIGHEAQQADRLEIRHRVVIQGVDGRVDDVGAQSRADKQRIAVGRRARDAARADASRRTGDVFDDDRLTERPLHALGNDAGEYIGRPARRERHDHRDRADRESLGAGNSGKRRKDGAACRQTQNRRRGSLIVFSLVRGCDRRAIDGRMQQ